MPAAQEIWIFGDELLKQSAGWLKRLESAFINDRTKPQLYMHEHYNVKTYVTPNKGKAEEENANFIQNVRNEIATTVMRKIMLPQKILVMLSSERLSDPVFSIECMEGLLRWLLDEIEDIVKFQKKCLPEKSKNFDTPRVYFLKILPKPNESPRSNLFKGVRRKFNNTLQSMLESYHQFGFINVHEITTRNKDEKFFITKDSGLLSDEGTIQLWDSISQTFKAIDMKIKPKAITKDQSSQWDPNDFRQERKDRKSYDRDSQNSIRNSAYKAKTYNCYHESDRYNRPHYSSSYYY